MTERRCYVCRSPDAIELHHIVPRSLGGGEHRGIESPLVPLCAICHSKLHGAVKHGVVGLGLPPDQEKRMGVLVEAIRKAISIKQQFTEEFEDRELHTVSVSVTPKQLRALHRLKLKTGHTSLDSFLKKLIENITAKA